MFFKCLEILLHFYTLNILFKKFLKSSEDKISFEYLKTTTVELKLLRYTQKIGILQIMFVTQPKEN